MSVFSPYVANWRRLTEEFKHSVANPHLAQLRILIGHFLHIFAGVEDRTYNNHAFSIYFNAFIQ